MLPGTLKKALLWSAFLFFGSSFYGASLARAQCEVPGGAQSVRIEHVVDGDTLILDSGQSVRLIGINAPEIGREGRRSQPWAQAARKRLQAMRPDIRYLVAGKESRDHYGRLLAHLFLEDGRSVEAVLLAEGLGFSVAIPPNLSMHDCLRSAEQRARRARLGVWGRPVPSVGEVLAAGDPAGFHVLVGVVTDSAADERAPYLELNDVIALKLGDLARSAERIRALKPGDRVEVRGWLTDRGASSGVVRAGYPRWLISIGHPDHIKRIP